MRRQRIRLTAASRRALRALSTRQYTRPNGIRRDVLTRLWARGLVSARWCREGSIMVDKYKLSPRGVRALLWGRS